MGSQPVFHEVLCLSELQSVAEVDVFVCYDASGKSFEKRKMLHAFAPEQLRS